jgi:hypothetical protein
MDGSSRKERSLLEPNSVYLAGSMTFHRFNLERISLIEKKSFFPGLFLLIKGLQLLSNSE